MGTSALEGSRGFRTALSALVVSLALLSAACTPQSGAPASSPTEAPPPPPGTPLLPSHLDCARWRYDGVQPGPLPAEWDADDYRFGSFRDRGSARSPQRLCGQLGAAVDLAWSVNRGRADVVIAVLDSGIRWRDEHAMIELADQAYLNRAELPPPEPQNPAGSTDPYDLNADGRFTVSDYTGDSRVGDRNSNELLDPEDLILSPELNDGTDADANGWVDDISGWDLLHDDNNPFDDVDYGHGTGEARDATAAHNGVGDAGTCPGCLHLPVRVSDSFIAEGGRFAAGVLFGLDSGADVILEALGAISNPSQVQEAIDAAHRRGVPVVASMADEQSQHPNLPAALERTIPVNSVTEAPGIANDVAAAVNGRRDALALNGCTNTGGYAWLSVPSNGCSSEATGNAAGMVALVEATARDAGIAPHPDLVAAGVVGPDANVLSADEVAQVLRATADDIDFSTPNAVDGPNRFTDDYGQRRFPSVKGWDATHGYGRINAYEAVRAVATGEIPPEVDLSAPDPFATLPTSGTLEVRGRVAAVRSGSYGYRVEWTTGLQAPPYPGADQWRVVEERNGLTAPVDGPLAALDLAEVAAALPGAGTGPPVTAHNKPDPDRFTVRVRVVVTDAEGRVGTMHRHVQVHHDPDRLAAPSVPGAGASSPVFADLDSNGAEELVVSTDDGYVHAFASDGRELPGWPVSTGPAPYWHAESRTAVEDGLAVPGRAISVGAPSVADLEGDGTVEVVVTDLDGAVHVFGADGTRRARMEADPAYSAAGATDERNRMKRGFVGGAALGDLDGDGALDVVAAGLDRHVYAWRADGAALPGFPVLVVDPAQTAAVDPVSESVTFRDPDRTGQGGELIATPALGDLDGDGRPEIVIGAQEQYDETPAVFPGLGVPGTSGNTRVYAISPNGSASPVGSGATDRNPAHPDDTAYLPGWPVALPMFLTGVLPTIGNGVNVQAAIGDVDRDGANEVVAASVGGPVMVLDADGTSPYAEPLGVQLALQWLNAPGAGTNSTDTAALSTAFGGPALGRFGSPDGWDVVAPTSGLGRALDTLFVNDQAGDPQLTVWSGADGSVRPGFPRVAADLAFFVTPAVADVDGDGANEAVAGNGVQMLDAFSRNGVSPAGWPKLTGGWVVGTPGFGDWNGDGTAEVAVTRRDGHLLVWRTPTAAQALGDWTRFGGNDRNTGSPSP